MRYISGISRIHLKKHILFNCINQHLVFCFHTHTHTHTYIYIKNIQRLGFMQMLSLFSFSYGFNLIFLILFKLEIVYYICKISPSYIHIHVCVFASRKQDIKIDTTLHLFQLLFHIIP